MADYKDRLGGTPTAGPTGVIVATQAVLLVAAAVNRIAVSVQPTADIYVGVATAMTASAAIAQVPSGVLMQECNYRGDLYGVAAAATAIARVTDFRY